MKNESGLLRCLVIALLFLPLFSNNIMGQGLPETTLDNYTGTWSNNGSWESGTSPGVTGLNVNVDVYGYITRYGDLDFNNGDLHIFDTLVIYGNLTLGNNADLFLSAGAILLVHGDVYSGNQVEVASGGIIIVTGTWTMDGSDKQGSFDNDGQLYIFDPGDGLKEGDGYEDINCDTCVMGFDDLIDSDIGDFFLGESYTITASGPTTFCSGGSVTLSTTDTATNYQWYKDGVFISGATSDTYVATASGEYHVEFDITYNGITQSFSPSAVTVTVNPLNTITLTSAVGTDDQSLCENSSLTDITYATTGATGAIVTGLPAGVTGSWAGDAVTISGTPTSPGTFNYTVELSGGCGTVTAAGTIVVDALPPAPPEINGDTNVCTPFTTTYSTTSVADNTYQWSVVGGTIVGADTDAEVTVSWTGTDVGTIEVTVTSLSGCSVSNSENIIKYATPDVGNIISGSQLTRR